MKKRMAVLLGSVLVMSGGLAAYGNPGMAVKEAEKEMVKTQSGEDLKMGLAVIANAGKSKDAVDGEGTAQADVDIASVIVDAEGKIVECTIDSLQTRIQFDETGKITTDLDTEILTKQELGEQYGLKEASSIGKEWNEQANAFAEYCIGKTAEEISGIAVTEGGTAEDADLAASCTIYFGGFQELVVKAVNNAK